MYMPFLISRRNYFSEMVRGGDITADIGIVRSIMIADGLIIVVIHLGIIQYHMIGEIIIETTCGVVTPGILLTSITSILIIIGAAVIGVMTMDGEALAVVGMYATCRAVVGMDVTCMVGEWTEVIAVEGVDARILMGEWTEVIVAIADK
jgi:hypothetical protein